TVKLKTDKSDGQLKEEAAKYGMKIKFLSDYTKEAVVSSGSTLLINYTALESDTMEKAVSVFEKIL
ncbi:MAG: PLP-dependent aminotransferase family protein, partial [Clostridia bacterium]